MFHPKHALTLTMVLLTAATASAEIDFAHDVVPILQTHCVECHSGEQAEGGFSLNTRRLLLESEHVVPGQPAASHLLDLIRSDDVDSQMPPSDRKRVPAADIAVLQQWIESGVAWEPGFRFGEAAWEPPLLPRQIQLPPAQYPDQHPIDRLLASWLTEHQVPELQPIDDAAFLRRVSLDLLGLLPTLAEQDQFFKDDSDSKRRQQIDQMLSRKHDYAEHWLSFWNDLLRNDYRGTGYIDGGRKQITGWLYQSLVDNKPYDVLVRELIAPTPESEGFIRGIKWRGDVNASQVREIQFAQNVGQVLLGINLKCASCHDSFIDRWTLDEAYSLAAVFSERELEIHRCDKPTGRIAEAAWLFPELGQIDAAAPRPERLQQLSQLITQPQNGRFSRTIVNRLWHRLMGHGIVHPVDAMHTQPWHADLLDYLANELVSSGYNLKHILRLITTSRAYQAQSAPAADAATSGDFVFRGPVARHLTAEQFIDAVWQVTGTAPDSIDAPLAPGSYLDSTRSTDTTPGPWVWGHDQAAQAAAGEKQIFRRQLSLTTQPAWAACVITCDNSYVLSVNGQQVRKDGDFAVPDLVVITSRLQSGDNTILIEGKNGGKQPNPAGLFVDIVLHLSDGTVQHLPGGTDWQVRDNTAVNGAEAEWQPVVPLASQEFPGATVNDRIHDLLHLAVTAEPRPVRAALVNSDLLMRSLGRPNREQVVTSRPASLSTLQAIDLANGQILSDLLATGGDQLLSTIPQNMSVTDYLFRSALGRIPTAAERKLAHELLGPDPSGESVQDLLWTILMLPEFQFIR